MSGPSFLPPPPKRGAGVRRLNRLPIYIGIGAMVCVGGAVVYTFHVRSQHATAQQAGESKKSTAGRATVLDGAPTSGYIAANLGGLHKIDPGASRMVPNPTTAPAPAAAMAVPSEPAQMQQSGGEDVATQARRAAWAAYYAQVADLQRRRAEARNDAMVADIGSGPSGSAGGATTPNYSQPTQPNLSMPTDPAFGGVQSPYGPALPDNTGAREKQQFLARAGISPADDTLLAVVRDPISPYLVTAGDVIQATMQGGADSDTPGQITGRVSTDVYDSATGQHRLIPAGSKLVGTYDSQVSAGQDRLPAVITRIIFPDSSSINIAGMPAADQGGYGGMSDQVDHHFWDKFGNALIVAVASAGIQISQPQSRGNNGYDSQQLIAGGLGQQFGQLGQEIARAGLAIPNTIRIRPGYPFVVKLTKDIVLRPYVDGRGAQQISFGPTIP